MIRIICIILLIIVLLSQLIIIIIDKIVITNIVIINILRWTLRCGVWIVFLLALLGNGCVVFVLSCSRNRIDVPRSVIIITTINIIEIIIITTIITTIIKINIILSSISTFRFLVCNLAMADFFMGLYLGEQAKLPSSKLNHLIVN